MNIQISLSESSRPPSKRRKRKGSASTNAGSANINNRDAPPSGKQKRSPGPQGFNLGSTVPGVSFRIFYDTPKNFI